MIGKVVLLNQDEGKALKNENADNPLKTLATRKKMEKVKSLTNQGKHKEAKGLAKRVSSKFQKVKLNTINK